MNKENFFNQVYDVLRDIGGASETYRYDFLYLHCHDPNECTEYRFQGKLGHGGKYRSQRNKVDCYQEDATPERLAIIKKVNAKLATLEVPPRDP